MKKPIVIILVLLLILVGVYWLYTTGNINRIIFKLNRFGMTEEEKEEKAARIRIKTMDSNRKGALLNLTYGGVLEKYYEENNQYPISKGLEKINDKSCILWSIIVQDKIPIDPLYPEFYYTYKSDGQSYELIARLENLEDKNCIIENGICLYKCRDGVCGVKKQEEKTEPYFKILYPNGGEKLVVGETYNITWDFNEIEKVDIFIAEGAHDRGYIILDIDANLGKYSWKVKQGLEFPSGGISGNPQLKIGIFDHKTGKLLDQSDGSFAVVNEDETAEWKTYQNNEYGHEMKYPKNWNYQEEIPHPQNFGIAVKFNNLQGKHILTIQNPIPEIGYEAWIIIKTEKIKIQNSEKYLTKQILKPKEKFKNENFDNLVLVSWNLENWNKSGQISFSFLEDSDPNLEILNQMLSTFKFIEVDKTADWKTYKKGIFTLKYPSEIWNLKNERLFHKEIGDSCAIIPGGLWRNTLIKIVESVDTNFNGYEARQIKLGSNEDEVSIINVYFDANLSGKEFRLSLPKDKQDKQICENDFKEALSTIKFEK